MNRSAKLIATSEAGLATQIVLQMVCGVLLAFWYNPSPAGAHAATAAILAGGFPKLVAGIHFWGGHVLMAHSLVHLTAMLWAGAYRDVWVPRWYLAVGVCACSFGLLVTGNLLPFDRHGVQSAVTEIAVGGQVPVFGPLVSDAMARGEGFGAATLSGWYAVHRWLIPLLLVGLFVGSQLVRAFQESIRKSAVGIVLPSVLAIVLAVAVRTPLGDAAGKADFGRFDATVNWYAWPLHGALKAFSAISPDLGWIGSALLPMAVLIYLLMLPRVCEKVTPIFVRGSFAVIVGAFLAMGLAFGDWPASPLARRVKETPKTVAGDGAQIDSALAQRGEATFQRVNCGGCHGPGGRGGSGGPSLTKIGLEHSDAGWYKKWIRDPSAVNPGSTMPAYPSLTEAELSELAEYLRGKGRESATGARSPGF